MYCTTEKKNELISFCLVFKKTEQKCVKSINKLVVFVVVFLVMFEGHLQLRIKYTVCTVHVVQHTFVSGILEEVLHPHT